MNACGFHLSSGTTLSGGCVRRGLSAIKYIILGRPGPCSLNSIIVDGKFKFRQFMIEAKRSEDVSGADKEMGN